MSGTFARTGSPGVLAVGTYDDSNRLTTRGTTSYSYDDVGNMTSNGTQTFTWNPRGQLAQITGGSVPASFVYDATGRRRQATFNATTTSFLNDGPNLVQDLQAGSAVATHLNGLAVDRTVATTTSGGTQARLPDALGSTVALTDASGNVVTDYTHDPYGTPTTLGAGTSNRIAYAGREIDPTGLSFNRNRYYNPAIGRFISEDPIGLGGGQTNRWAYVGNDPLGQTDPYGLFPGFDDVWDGVKNGADAGWDYITDPTTYTSAVDYWHHRDWSNAHWYAYRFMQDYVDTAAAATIAELGFACTMLGGTVAGETFEFPPLSAGAVLFVRSQCVPLFGTGLAGVGAGVGSQFQDVWAFLDPKNRGSKSNQ